MQGIDEILKKKSFVPNTRNKYEFQAYGNRLAEEFCDTKHRALYIKLAKNQPRGKLEAAREFVMAQENITEKGKLFMWKLKQLNSKEVDNKQ